MKKSNYQNQRTARGGFSLMELIVTTAMLATLSASCMVIVRTSYTAWNRHEDDLAQRQQGLVVLQHIIRHTRQAASVIAISPSTETSGSISMLDAAGNILVWQHNAGTKEVRFGITTATNVLATNIEELGFVAFKADGTTPTTDPGLIHVVQCTTKINITRPAGTETIATSNRAWLRAW